MRLGLFLVGAGSHYQDQQRAAAASAARAAGVELDVFLAEGGSKTQREQLFGYIRSEKAPAGVIVHAVEESGLRIVCQEALRRRTAWAMVHRAPAWIADLIRDQGGLAFCVTVDQTGIGRLQGEQYRALLPEGGTVLYVTGPSLASSTKERQAGMEGTKGPSLSAISVVGSWTEASGSDAVHRWLDTTRGFVHVDLIGAQNDDMAVGAGHALGEAATSLQKPEWRDLPLTGVDGIPQYGQRLVDEETLTATIIVPPTAGTAVELLAATLRGAPAPPQVTTVRIVSYPHLDLLRKGR